MWWFSFGNLIPANMRSRDEDGKSRMREPILAGTNLESSIKRVIHVQNQNNGFITQKLMRIYENNQNLIRNRIRELTFEAAKRQI